jgi:RHS repeat-associated protein
MVPTTHENQGNKMKSLSRFVNCIRTFSTLSLAAMLYAPTAQATSTVTYFHNDVSGTPQLATDASGAVVWKETYQPYGGQTVNSAAESNNKLWFVSKPYDSSSGLSYFGARYYDPVTGRFAGMDPVGVDIDNLSSFNRYAYGNNNPYKYVDNDGEQAQAAPLVIPVVVIGLTWYALQSPERQRQLKESLTRAMNQHWTHAETAPDSGAESGKGAGSGANSAAGSPPPDDGDHTKVKDTTTGRSVRNTDVNISRADFEKNLEENGFQKSVSQDGKVTNFLKDDVKYSVRDFSNSRGPTVDMSRGGELVQKIRLTGTP